MKYYISNASYLIKKQGTMDDLQALSHELTNLLTRLLDLNDKWNPTLLPK